MYTRKQCVNLMLRVLQRVRPNKVRVNPVRCSAGHPVPVLRVSVPRDMYTERNGNSQPNGICFFSPIPSVPSNTIHPSIPLSRIGSDSPSNRNFPLVILSLSTRNRPANRYIQEMTSFQGPAVSSSLTTTWRQAAHPRKPHTNSRKENSVSPRHGMCLFIPSSSAAAAAVFCVYFLFLLRAYLFSELNPGPQN